jgi:BirA family biotin operon repressor/biotin-[acetyl-CoA-carboxylase] ligase
MNESDLVRALAGGPVSGDALAREAGVTRAAIWKRIVALREGGLEVSAAPGQGYALARPVDLLDGARILAGLPAPARALVDDLEVAWRVDSTSSELLRRTPSERASVLFAEHQTGGRGRRGRSWASPLGANLYLSVGRRFSGGLARLAGLALVAGVAVADALRGIGCAGIRLKWPNDLVVDAGNGGLRKLGGLLVEGGGEHAGPVRAVIGLGLNLRMPGGAAAGIDQPWADLGDCIDADVSRNAVAAAVLGGLLPALDRFDAEGLAPFLSDYASIDALAGRHVAVHAGERVSTGEAIGIDPSGALLVRLADGRIQAHHAGEASVRPRPPGGDA